MSMSDITLTCRYSAKPAVTAANLSRFDDDPGSAGNRQGSQFRSRQSQRLFHVTKPDELGELAEHAARSDRARPADDRRRHQRPAGHHQPVAAGAVHRAAGAVGSVFNGGGHDRDGEPSTAGAPSAAAGNLLLSVGTSTATIAITSGEALTAIESAINSASTTTLGGAVSASDNGSGDLVLSSTSTTFYDWQQRHRDGARRHHGSGHRHQHHADVAAEQLQHAADADQSAGRGLRLQRRQSDRRQQSADQLQRDRHQLADDQRRELQSAGLGLSSISGSAAGSFFDTSTLSSLVTNINSGDLERAEPDRDVRHQFVDHLDPAIVHDQHDQHAADRRQQPGGG